MMTRRSSSATFERSPLHQRSVQQTYWWPALWLDIREHRPFLICLFFVCLWCPNTTFTGELKAVERRNFLSEIDLLHRSFRVRRSERTTSRTFAPSITSTALKTSGRSQAAFASVQSPHTEQFLLVSEEVWVRLQCGNHQQLLHQLKYWCKSTKQ
jgi:hypothetical protein